MILWLQRGAQASNESAARMRAGDGPLYGAASAGQMGAAGLVTRAGAAGAQSELGTAKNPVYMMQVHHPFLLHQEELQKCPCPLS